MKKRNSKIQEFILPANAKVLSSQISTRGNRYLVSGDDKNNIIFWKFDKEKPISSFSHQSSSQTQIEVTSVLFSYNETEIYSGSNRGVINVWDLNSQRLSTTLKGHSVSVNTLCKFPLEEANHILISGSYDSNLKIWDLRQKQVISTLKGHIMQINCLDGSPDGKLIVSGSQDATVKIWDLSLMKNTATFPLHDGPITCVKFNPDKQTLATGSQDKTVKYWDIEHIENKIKKPMISETKPEATSILKICFSSQGKSLFSSAVDSLKIWNMEKEGLLLDNVETSWRGVLDMVFNENENNLFGVTSTPVYFGLWASPLESLKYEENIGKINFDMKNVRLSEPKEKKNENKGSIQFLEAQKILQQKNIDINLNNVLGAFLDKKTKEEDSPKKELLIPEEEKSAKNMNIIKNNVINPINPFQKKHFSIDDKEELFERKKINIDKEDSSLFELGHENQADYFDVIIPPKSPEIKTNIIKQEKFEKNKFEDAYEVKRFESLENNNFFNEEKNKFETSIINTNNNNNNFNNELHYSSFIIDKDNNEKYFQFDIINDVSKAHCKFISVLNTRMNYIKPIVHYLNANNVKSAIFLITKLTHSHLIMDALNIMNSLRIINNLNIENATIILEKSMILIESKYENHIIFGIDIAQIIMNNFKDEIINIKNPAVLNKVDLAREERIAKYDKIIENIKILYNMPRIQKILNNKKSSIYQNTYKLKMDIEYLLKKIQKIE